MLFETQERRHRVWEVPLKKADEHFIGYAGGKHGVLGDLSYCLLCSSQALFQPCPRSIGGARAAGSNP